ncbi:unnamed protein product, partial (macronuclear) [Paramecium tetraurelia]
MNCKKQQVEDLYGLLAQSKAIDEVDFLILIKMLEREKTQDCLNFFSQYQNIQQIEKERQEVTIQSILDKEQILNFGKNNVKRIFEVLKKIEDHDFNRYNYSGEEYKEIKQDLIAKISQDKKIIELLKFLVNLTALDERFIQCGSNSLHLLVQIKVDLKGYSFENIRIRNTSLLGANLMRCDLSGSEFENVIVSGMNLNEAKLFNCKWMNLRIEELRILDGHHSTVNQVYFSFNGQQLISCSDDKSIRFWDVKTGKIKCVIKGNREVNSVCFSPKNTISASCSGEFVYLWNLNTGKQVLKFIGHTDCIRSICFSPYGTTLASGSDDKSIHLWDIKTGQKKAKLAGHSSTVTSVCFSPDGTKLASGSGDKSVRLWDIKTGKQKAKFVRHSIGISSVCFAPDGRTIASGSGDKSILLWDIETGYQNGKLDGHSSTVTSVYFSPDGTTLASGSGDNSIRLWDIKTGQQKAKLDGHSGIVKSVCFSSNVEIILFGYGILRQDNKKSNQMVIHIGFHQSVSLLMVLHWHLVVEISLSVYGMLRQDNNMPNQMVIKIMFIQSVSLLTVLHQHLV